MAEIEEEKNGYTTNLDDPDRQSRVLCSGHFGRRSIADGMSPRRGSGRHAAGTAGRAGQSAAVEPSSRQDLLERGVGRRSREAMAFFEIVPAPNAHALSSGFERGHISAA